MPMIEKLLPAAALLVLGTMVQPATAQPTPRSSATSPSDTVSVAPPTGERAADRASILTALEQAGPGDVIQFAPGTYLVGEVISVTVPRVTLLGHPDGTTLRGCDPDSYEQLERDRQAARDDLQERLLVMRRCGVFEMIGGHGTVRGLTFEHTWMGLALGSQGIEDRKADRGYLVENNVFRNSGNGVTGGNLSSTPTVIRGNRFVNVFHALSADALTVHMLDNDISVPGPEGSGFAIGISAAEDCVIEGNRVEGHPSGIVLWGSPGRASRRNVIRDNTITGTVFPLRLWADQEDAEAIQIEDNLIERNRIMGGVVGIALNRASGNRILNNTITGITVRDPSLGEANGAGLWLSAGSDENEIAGTTFEDVAGAEVFLEGDRNRVELRSTADSVQDLGTDNEATTSATQRLTPAAGSKDQAAGRDTVHVAPPTGDEADRASILAALERAGPGEIVQFAVGTYLVGEVIRIETPRITLLGHPEGTVLRGCDPDEYEASERDVTAAQGMPSPDVAARCGMFELSGGEVTVRGLTFEYSRLGLLLGCCHTEPRFRSTPGGYTIERNVFRNSLNGIRPWTTEPSVIRENEFINTFHAISGVGSHLHVLDNEISVPQPSRVPGIGHPSFAIALGPLPGRAADALSLEDNGEGYVISGNRIEGHPDGILIAVYPGTTFRGNVLRDNTIRVSRVPIPPSGPRPWIVDVTAEADSSIVGIPITLYARPGFPGAEADDQEDGWFEDNLLEGNRILGAEGVGIALQRGRGNRIVENSISDVARRDPFPGNTVVSSSELWEAANGSGIWISPDSEDNEVAGNTFVDVAGDAVAPRHRRSGVPSRIPDDR